MGSGAKVFDVSTSQSDANFTQQLIEKHNFKKSTPTETEAKFINWFAKVLSKLSRWDAYYEYADWYVS